MRTLKNIKLENVIITIIVGFIIFTLAAVTIELFSNLDYLNRLF